MSGGVGNCDGRGQTSGPVSYDLARQVASSSIGFIAPIPAATNSAIADAISGDTWLDGGNLATAGAARPGWSPTDWVDNATATWKRIAIHGQADLHSLGVVVAAGRAKAWPTAAVDRNARWAA